MRFRLLALFASFALAACSETGTPGMAGAMGQQGLQGPEGPPGPKGDPGTVTVVDGGAIVGPAGPQGPAGASVQVQPLATGDSSCPQGGVRLTAGTAITVVCNGAQGATGPQGAQGAAGPQGPTGAQGATGPQGPAGPQGPKGNPGSGSAGDGGAAPATPVTITPLAVGDPNCANGGVSLLAGTATTYLCNGAPGVTGPQGPQGAAGPQGATGAQGVAGPQGPLGATGPQGPTGATGSQGPAGAAGPQGPAGTTGPQGPSGTAGAAAAIASVAPGSAGCPYGGTMFSVGGTTSYACNGGPVNAGNLTLQGGIPPVALAGYTPTSYTGNLGGRAGAHALCAAAFSGSHFCTNWEADQADPPPMSVNAWVDAGNPTSSSRLFHLGISSTSYAQCAGWTTGAANFTVGGNLATGDVLTMPYGGVQSSSTGLGLNDGGCEMQLPLACCQGGTAVRFRGFSPSTSGGNLGGRLGANATCAAAFSGSHFCTDWEADQAAIPAPIPSTGAWVDAGNSDSTTRSFHLGGTANDTGTCGDWTSSSGSYKPNGNQATGNVWDPLGGGTISSFVGLNDGGCENPRPLACCDGYPPR